jgi:hypothetical protein
MIKIDGEYYYMDLDALSECLESDDNLAEGTIKETETTTWYDEQNEMQSKEVKVIDRHKPKEVDGFKFQFLTQMIDLILHTDLEFDESTMKASFSKAPTNYLVAFNTLLKLKILKKL